MNRRNFMGAILGTGVVAPTASLAASTGAPLYRHVQPLCGQCGEYLFFLDRTYPATDRFLRASCRCGERMAPAFERIN